MFPPASDFMKSLYLFSLILSSHFIRSEPVKTFLLRDCRTCAALWTIWAIQVFYCHKRFRCQNLFL